MKPSWALVCLALSLLCLPAAVAAEGPDRRPGRLVQLIADPNPSTFQVQRFVPEPRGPFAPQAVSATINVNFLAPGAYFGETCGTWSAGRLRVFVDPALAP